MFWLEKHSYLSGILSWKAIKSGIRPWNWPSFAYHGYHHFVALIFVDSERKDQGFLKHFFPHWTHDRKMSCFLFAEHAHMSEKDSITVFCQEFRSISGTVLSSKENWGKKNAILFHGLPNTCCSYGNTAGEERVSTYFCTRIDTE